MPANLENSAVATGLEKVSFHSNPKEGQYQRMFKLLHNCNHLTCQQSNAQNSLNQALTVQFNENFQKFKLDLEKTEDPEFKLPTFIGSQKKQENTRTASTSLFDYPKAFDCVELIHINRITRKEWISLNQQCVDLQTLQKIIQGFIYSKTKI